MFTRLFSGLLLAVFVIGCSPAKPTTPEFVEHTRPTPASPSAVERLKPVQDELILYAIDPFQRPMESDNDDKQFRGYLIVGKVAITEPAGRQEILKAIADGFTEGPQVPAACFWPRHGVHVVTNGKSIDYVICYECLGARIYTAEGTSGKTTAATHQAVLNAPLAAAGIKLAPSIEELQKSN